MQDYQTNNRFFTNGKCERDPTDKTYKTINITYIAMLCQSDIYTPMHIAALFIIAELGKQSKGH